MAITLACAIVSPAGAFACAQEEQRRPPAVWALEFSPDGKYLAAAVGSGKEGGAIVVWSVADGKPIVMHFEDRGGSAAAFSPNGKQVAFGTSSPRVGILSIDSGKVLRAWDAHENRVLSIAFTPDGKSLATGSADRTIKLWELETAKLQRTFEGHTEVVYGIDISPDGSTLLSGGGDMTARLWDLRTGEQKKSFQPSQLIVRRVGFSRDGQYFFTSRYDAWARIQDVAQSEMRAKVRGGNSCADLSPDNRLFVASSFDSAAQVFELNVRAASTTETSRIAALIKRFEDEDYSVREATSRELEKIGLAAEPLLREAMTKSTDAEVRLRSRLVRRKVMSPEPIGTLGGHRGEVEVVCFSPDGALVATGCRGGDVKVWKVGSFQELLSLQAPVAAKK
jgi:WD40 repeat protein